MKNGFDQESHERLCAYLLGEMDASERAAFEAELAASEELRAERERLEAVIGLVQTGAEGSESLSPEARARLATAAAGAGSGGVRRTARLRPLMQLAAAAGVLSLAWLGLRSMQGGAAEDGSRQDTVARFDRAEADSVASAAQVRELESAKRLGLEGGSAAESSGEFKAHTDSVLHEEASDIRGQFAENVRVGEITPAPAARAAAEVPEMMMTEDESSLGLKDEALAKSKESSDTSGASHSNPLPSESVAGLAEPNSIERAPISKNEERELTEFEEQKHEPTDSAGHHGLSVSADLSRRAGSRGGGGGGYGGKAAPRGATARTSGASSPERASPGASPLPALRVQSGSNDFFLGRGLDGAAAAGVITDGWRGLPADQVISGCCLRFPDERPRDMFFRFWGDNAFVRADQDALSTFAADVDTASYALARKYLYEGMLPEKAQVRTEEFVNYFDPDLPAPTAETFALSLELAPSRFGGTRSERWLLRATVRGHEVATEERRPMDLVFVVDVSGSMNEGGRLELVKNALRLLLGRLYNTDTVSLVAFSQEARLVLPQTSAGQRGLIESAIAGLSAAGGTFAQGGLRMGYAQALASLREGASTRVVLLSDGVANIGQTDQYLINTEVSEARAKGVLLNTVGVGMNNHNDTFLEQLADKGDGLCNYVDSEAEARRALVENFTGAFETIARDVKIQLEFDPGQVLRWRQLGYENRAIADQDFRNDRVDAGEVGSGHQVTALYELELSGATDPERALATLRVRYKGPDATKEDPAREVVRTLSAGAAAGSFQAAGPGFRRAAIAAQFAEILRRSVHARGDSLDDLIAEADRLDRERKDPEFTEFYAMLVHTRNLVLEKLPRMDELALTVDLLRENAVSRAELEDLGARAEAARLAELASEAAALEARIRDLCRTLEAARDR